MSKIILEAFKTDKDSSNDPTSLLRNIVQITKVAHLKYVDGIPYIYIGSKKLNKLIGTIDGVTKEVFTLIQPTERPDLNIQNLEINIIT